MVLLTSGIGLTAPVEAGPSFHTAALDDMRVRQGGAAVPEWRFVLIGQLCMLAAFTGTSLLAIALLMALHGQGEHALRESLAIGSAGALLDLLAWRRLCQELQRAEKRPPARSFHP